jgi:hypothetical protein
MLSDARKGAGIDLSYDFTPVMVERKVRTLCTLLRILLTSTVHALLLCLHEHTLH